MADTRLPDRWLTDAEVQAMSDAGWRFFTTALMFCNRMENDGRLRDVELRFLPIDASEDTIAEVIATGRLERVEGGYQFMGWGEPDGLGQTTKATHDARREGDRKRKAKQRDTERSTDVPTSACHSGSHGVTDAASQGRSHATSSRKGIGLGIGQGSTQNDHMQSAHARQDEPPPHEAPLAHEHPPGEHVDPRSGEIRGWATVEPGAGWREPPADDPGYCSACGMTGKHTSSCKWRADAA